MKTQQYKSSKIMHSLNGIITACVMLGVLLGACAPAATPAPPTSTATLAPTLTSTPAPTATITLTPTPADTATPEATATPAEINLIGAGDIVNCDGAGGKATAKLLAQFPGATIFTAGDNIDHLATPKEFKNCFGPTWGVFKNQIHPAIGDMEYNMKKPPAYAYFDYFGAAAGTPQEGWYSYDVGGWHIVVLNSECARVNGCQAGSPQEKWLKDDLAAHPAQCSMAVWHMPRFYSALAQGLPAFKDVWQDLYDAGVELVVNAHLHYYMRYAPMDVEGQLDEAKGIQEFIVGTGGAIPLVKGAPSCTGNCQVLNNTTFGVIKLTLHPDSYDWAFVPEPGKTFTDGGSRACH
jgi:hypothetical protein